MIEIIDVRDDPIDVIKKISACDYVVSSSLHGLIIAHSFYIPTVPLVVPNKPMKGDGFKFRDYYSAFDSIPRFYVLTGDEGAEDFIREASIPKYEKIATVKELVRRVFDSLGNDNL